MIGLELEQEQEVIRAMIESSWCEQERERRWRGQTVKEMVELIQKNELMLVKMDLRLKRRDQRRAEKRRLSL
jgi:predicted glycosyl hydrolase (DUF1957 family)